VNINVIAHPNSKHPRIEKDLLGNFHVYVSAPPLEGHANMEIVLTLAKYLKLKKHQIQLISGEASKYKTISILT